MQKRWAIADAGRTGDLAEADGLGVAERTTVGWWNNSQVVPIEKETARAFTYHIGRSDNPSSIITYVVGLAL